MYHGDHPIQEICPRFTREEEAALAVRVQAGDGDARRTLMRSILPWVLRLACRWGREYHDRDELFSLGVEVVYDRLLLFDPARGRLTTFVGAVLCRRFARERKREATLRRPQELPEDLIGREHDPERWRRVALIDRGVDRLPPREADVVRRRMAGQTLREVGDALSLSKERVRQIEAQAHDRLRAYLRNEGHV